MKKWLLGSVFYILCFYAQIALCEKRIEPPPSNFDAKTTLKDSFQVFPVSSEFQIGKIKPFIEVAPSGLYLTVGSERGFRAASMMKQITYLWLVDVSDIIIRYNLINRELLKVPNRETYLFLRWDATFKEWEDAKNRAEKDSHVSINLTKNDFDWWLKNVRDIEATTYKLPEYLNRYQKSPVCNDKDVTDIEKKINLAQILDFKTGNYLFYDDLYQNLHRLALENRIFISKINLKEENQLDKLLEYLNKNKLSVGVLDLDNLYFKDYIGQDVYQKIVQKMLEVGFDNSVLITMSNYKSYACGQYQIYIGFRFSHIRKWPSNFKMQDFIDSFPFEINDLIDGRLYEKDDLLPCFINCPP